MSCSPVATPLRLALGASGGVALAFGLFCLQFALLGLVPVTASPWPAETLGWQAVRLLTALHVAPLVLAVLPSVVVAYALARSFAGAILPGTSSTFRAKTLVAIWVLAWCMSSLLMHILLGGTGPAPWSYAYLAQPSVWYGLVGCSVGLFLGARRAA